MGVKPKTRTKTKPSSAGKPPKKKPSSASKPTKPKSTAPKKTPKSKGAPATPAPAPQSFMSSLRNRIPDAAALRKFGYGGLALYGGMQVGDKLLDWLRPKTAVPASVRPSGGGGAMSPSGGGSAVTPNPRPTPSNAGGQPTPQGSPSSATGGNNITPKQVQENAQNYPNSSGYPWGTLRGGQYIDASGREMDYTPSTGLNGETIGIAANGRPIAENQARYFNQRGMATAAQNDLDINAQLADRGSNLFKAIDRMRGGQLSQFRIGAEEADARQALRVKSMEMESKLRMAEFAKRQALADEEIRKRYQAGP